MTEHQPDARESANEWWDRTESFYREAKSVIAGSASDDTGRPVPSALAKAGERLGASLPGCPTPCDDDCELNPDGCHSPTAPCTSAGTTLAGRAARYSAPSLRP